MIMNEILPTFVDLLVILYFFYCHRYRAGYKLDIVWVLERLLNQNLLYKLEKDIVI